MATTNIWQQFKAIIPTAMRAVATIIINNGDGTSQAELRDGSVITIKGESISPRQMVFIQDGEIKASVPSLEQYEVEV